MHNKGQGIGDNPMPFLFLRPKRPTFDKIKYLSFPDSSIHEFMLNSDYKKNILLQNLLKSGNICRVNNV